MGLALQYDIQKPCKQRCTGCLSEVKNSCIKSLNIFLTTTLDCFGSPAPSVM